MSFFNDSEKCKCKKQFYFVIWIKLRLNYDNKLGWLRERRTASTSKQQNNKRILKRKINERQARKLANKANSFNEWINVWILQNSGGKKTHFKKFKCAALIFNELNESDI